MDIDQDLAGLRVALNRCRELRADGAAGPAREAEVSAWSVDQHLYHMALACDLSLRNVESLVAQKGLLIAEGVEPSEGTRAFFELEHFPRGQAEAPRMVRPSDEVDAEFLAREQEGNLQLLQRLSQNPGAITTAPNHIPHQLLGPLSAAMWLCFARLHTLHHLAIVDDVLAAVAIRDDEQG